MLPANERFDTGDLAGLEGHARLVMQQQFVAAQREPEVIFDRQAFLRLGVQRVGKELVVVAALGFRVVHGHIGVLHQGLRVWAIGGVDADADRAGCRQVVGVNHDRRGQCSDHFLGHLLRAFVRVLIFGAGKIFQDHREFVAAQTRDSVGGAHACGQARGDAL